MRTVANDEYKGYRIESRLKSGGVSTPAAPPYSPVTFFVHRKDGNLIHRGEVAGSFKTPQEAFEAGHKAAHAWIDAHEREDKK